MGRTIPAGLQPLLDLSSCNTQTTFSIYPVSGPPLHFATDVFTTEGNNYAADLRKTDELRQSIAAATDRVRTEIQNVDKTIGGTVTSESLVKAAGVIGRFHRKENDFSQNKWVELFRGEVIPIEITELRCQFEVVSDLVAAGYCVANWTLAENCQFVFKHTATCGYAGAETTCNKKRKSKMGCLGRSNEHHFGGMEFPDAQIPEPPVGGGVEAPVSGGSRFPTCPRIDQYTRVRGRHGQPVPRLVAEITADDLLFHPIWGTFHSLKSAEIVTDQPIWRIASENGGSGYSSHSHPVLSSRQEQNGSRVSSLRPGDPVLTWSNDLGDTRASISADTGESGDVMRIEMEDGHIYCYSDTPDGDYIVCHNVKPIGGNEY